MNPTSSARVFVLPCVLGLGESPSFRDAGALFIAPFLWCSPRVWRVFAVLALLNRVCRAPALRGSVVGVVFGGRTYVRGLVRCSELAGVVDTGSEVLASNRNFRGVDLVWCAIDESPPHLVAPASAEAALPVWVLTHMPCVVMIACGRPTAHPLNKCIR